MYLLIFLLVEVSHGERRRESLRLIFFSGRERPVLAGNYRKSSIKPPGGLIYFKPIWRGGGGGLNRDGGLFNLETTMISILRKKLEYNVVKLRYKKVEGRAAEDQNQIRTTSWYLNRFGPV